jgi:hypothetical protein
MILIGCLVGQAWAQANMGATHAASANAVKLLFNMGVSKKRCNINQQRIQYRSSDHIFTQRMGWLI